MWGGAYCALTPLGPNSVGLSGTDALGPLPSTAAVQPPAPMPRKSQTVSGPAPAALPPPEGYSARAQGLSPAPLAGGGVASSRVPGRWAWVGCTP